MQEVIKGKDYCVEFKSIDEFYKYISATPFNEAFGPSTSNKSSEHAGYDFTQTHDFNEAVTLMVNGWDDCAKKIAQKLEARKDDIVSAVRQKSFQDVAGFQACVPLYLQGVPTNMINRKNVPVKQRVVTINKCINYSCVVKTDKIIEESVKALMIVKKLEAQGTRVNVNVFLGTEAGGRRITCKVRIKNSSERLNISKMAFLLAHPSMLRRMMFRFIEVYPNTTSSFVSSYGHPIGKDEMAKMVSKGEYFIPAVVETSMETIKDLETFKV